MFCSTIIATIGRPSLDRAVNSVLVQDFAVADFEVIVVNDSGRPLAAGGWQQSDQVKIVDTRQRERSVARNVGAALAKGTYLHFLDDDDWLLPEALKKFRALSAQSNAASWLYGGVILVDPDENTLAELNLGMNGNCFTQAVAGAWFPLQASLILARAFFEAGGFHPLLPATQDIDLARRMALQGEFANLSATVAGVQRAAGSWNSSTNYLRAPLYNRWSRDAILAGKGAFSRLQRSGYSPYWHGRILHAYSSATLYNLRSGKFFTAISRFLCALRAVWRANYRLATAEYWQAVRDHHVPFTSTRAIRDRLDNQQ